MNPATTVGTPTFLRLLDIADRYGFRVETVWPRREPELTIDNGYSMGSQSCGIHFSSGTLLIPSTPSAYADISLEVDFLHEMCHLILGERSTYDVCEGYALLPFEWRMAHLLTRDLDALERENFLRGVHSYQRHTHLKGLKFDRYPTKREYARTWWKAGLGRARALGILSPRHFPTFRCAAWTPSLVRAADAFRVPTHSDEIRS